MSSQVNGVRLPFGRRSVAFGSNAMFFGSSVVRYDLDLVVAERPEDLGRDCDGLRWPLPRSMGDRTRRNHVSPLASRAVKPGCTPDVFSLITVHFDGSGGAPTIGPRRQLLGRDRGSVPIRFVNQLESGSSSIVLRFCARLPEGLLPDVTNKP